MSRDREVPVWDQMMLDSSEICFPDAVHGEEEEGTLPASCIRVIFTHALSVSWESTLRWLCTEDKDTGSV